MQKQEEISNRTLLVLCILTLLLGLILASVAAKHSNDQALNDSQTQDNQTQILNLNIKPGVKYK
jgi:Na+-transporting NADH:ubiquinone oxidoreductase subunit NqrC